MCLVGIVAGNAIAEVRQQRLGQEALGLPDSLLFLSQHTAKERNALEYFIYESEGLYPHRNKW